MKKLTTLLLIVVGFCLSCKFHTRIHLPTDDIPSSPDYKLILHGITDKIQAYTLERNLYKIRERRKVMKEIEDLSDEAFKRYREQSISRETYDAVQREAKYVLQQAIYMMRNETGPVTAPDTILNYLETGLKSINDLLNP